MTDAPQGHTVRFNLTEEEIEAEIKRCDRRDMDRRDASFLRYASQLHTNNQPLLDTMQGRAYLDKINPGFFDRERKRRQKRAMELVKIERYRVELMCQQFGELVDGKIDEQKVLEAIAYLDQHDRAWLYGGAVP